MLSEYGRPGVAAVARPIARGLLRLGVTPNGITLTGLVLTCAAAIGFLGNGMLVTGAVVIALCTLLDLLDGAVARAGDGGTPYGALVDAVSDRVADGAILASLAWWLVTTTGDGADGGGAGGRGLDGADRYTLGMLLAALVFSQVVSYSKARADAGGLATPGGLMERADRLVVILLGAGLEGLGVPFALAVAATVVALGSFVTVVQRMWGSRRDFLSRRDSGAHIGPDVGASPGTSGERR